MKQHHIFPLTLALVAVVIGGATILISTRGNTTPDAQPDAVITTISVTGDNTAAVGAFGIRTIQWTSSNYPADAKVSINLIRKISSNPAEYEFIRAIATNTANDGEEAWEPVTEDRGDDVYVEVVCSSVPTNSGCTSTSEPVKAF